MQLDIISHSIIILHYLQAVMNFFLDSCDLKQIEKFHDMGMILGVTTNPSILAKSDRGAIETLRDICAIVEGPVSAEVIATDFKGMMDEAKQLEKIADNIVIKLPITQDGIHACKSISKNGGAVNMTLCFSPQQAILAEIAGATFVSPFIGRLEDNGGCGVTLINQISELYGPESETLILAASIRNTKHVIDAFLAGADVVTCGPEILNQMFTHPLTDKGLEIFLNDWKKAKKSL